MVKQLKRITFVGMLVAAVWFGGLLADSGKLREELVRLHVVGASNSEADQAVKLQVRDAVLESLEAGLQDMTDVDAALAYVREMLPKVEQAANAALRAAGVEDTAIVTLTEEAFPTRDYDTFSLPAGVYQALRVVIGEGDGKNWWCVVFPQLCMGTGEDFVETASLAGFDEELTGALEGDCELRFWLLEKIGELRNLLFETSDSGSGVV